jgi:uncharacterized repeat protein (TIGR01451 family)
MGLEESSMQGKSTFHFRTQCVICGIGVLALLLILQSLGVSAAPEAAPNLGITPTPTNTPTTVAPTPTHTPTTVAPTPTHTPTAVAPTATPKAGSNPADPVITKRADVQEAAPGDEVTFTILVTNQGGQAAVDVVVTDELSEYLEILEVTTTQGTVTIEGQKVTVQVGTVGPGFVVEITIRTRVREDTPTPLNLENLALLKSPSSQDRQSPPVIVVISLPGLLPTSGAQGIGMTVPLILGCGLTTMLAGLLLARRER